MSNYNLENVFPKKVSRIKANLGSMHDKLKSNYSEEDNIEKKTDDKAEINIYSRPLIINANTGGNIDNDVVAYHLYNRFNYSLFLPEDHQIMRCTLGITSPNIGEGKTTAACNLAAALSIGSNRKTVIIDLNVNKPRIHEIFGTVLGPGLSDALLGKEIFVTPTQIENLFVVPAGKVNIIPTNKLANFNKVVNSLLKEFEFVIVDMPSLAARNFPTIIANQLNGLIVVAEVRKTRRRDIDRLFRQVHERNVVGFVLNKVNEDDF